MKEISKSMIEGGKICDGPHENFGSYCWREWTVGEDEHNDLIMAGESTVANQLLYTI